MLFARDLWAKLNKMVGGMQGGSGSKSVQVPTCYRLDDVPHSDIKLPFPASLCHPVDTSHQSAASTVHGWPHRKQYLAVIIIITAELRATLSNCAVQQVLSHNLPCSSCGYPEAESTWCNSRFVSAVKAATRSLSQLPLTTSAKLPQVKFIPYLSSYIAPTLTWCCMLAEADHRT